MVACDLMGWRLISSSGIIDKSEVGKESKKKIVDVRLLYSISPTLQHNSLVMLPPVAPPERKTVISSDKVL